MLEVVGAGTCILNDSTTLIDRLPTNVEKFRIVKYDTIIFPRLLYLAVAGSMMFFLTLNFMRSYDS
jgi:hypothetical protein